MIKDKLLKLFRQNMSNFFLQPNSPHNATTAKKGVISSSSVNFANQSLDKARQIAQSLNLGGLGNTTKSYFNNKINKKKDSKTNDIERNSKERHSRYTLKNHAEKLLPNDRVCKCCNQIKPSQDPTAPNNAKMEIKNKSDGTRTASLKNLFLCDGIWVCPICHQRIMHHRGKEIDQAFKQWLDPSKKFIALQEFKPIHPRLAQKFKGLRPYTPSFDGIEHQYKRSIFMLTLTHSHTLQDSLETQLNGMRVANKRFFGDRDIRAVFKQYGIYGQIRAREVTHGNKNGWHPHDHNLVFSKIEHDKFMNDTILVYFTNNKNEILDTSKTKIIDKYLGNNIHYLTAFREKKLNKINKMHLVREITIEVFLKHYWRQCCLFAGLGEPSWEHGLDIQNAEQAQKYLVKIQSCFELTNSQGKRGKNGNRNQWELLADSMAGDKQASKLFQEYANAFKGQRALFWSSSLKKIFDLQEVADSEIDETNDNDSNVISTDIVEIPNRAWWIVRKNRLQPHIIDIAEKWGAVGLNEFIDLLPHDDFLFSFDILTEFQKYKLRASPPPK